jgi:hypothetical protein
MISHNWRARRLKWTGLEGTTSARKLIDHLDQAVLAKAFRGELVPQDPNDEPASVLLERIRAERQVTATPQHQKADRANERLVANDGD